jgi:hypothetical protein
MRVEFVHDRARSEFRLKVEGEGERRMPELSGWELREWHHRYASAFEPVLGARDLAAQSPAMDDLADALLEYDRHGRLGTRDWLEKHLTNEQFVLILQRIQATYA